MLSRNVLGRNLHNDGQNQSLSEDLALLTPEQLSFLSPMFQEAFPLELSGMATDSESLPFPGSVEQQGEQTRPFRNTWNQATTIPHTGPQGQWSPPIWTEDSSAYAKAASGHERDVSQPLQRHEGLYSGTPDAEEQNMVAGGDEGSILVIEASPSPSWNMPRAQENPDTKGYGKALLTQQQHLRTEPQNRWPCPFCDQRFKRRDYVKPHVRRKHPQLCESLPSIPSFTPDQFQVATPACACAQKSLSISGLSEYHGSPLLVPPGELGLESHTPASLQFGHHSSWIGTPSSEKGDSLPPGSDMQARKRSHDSAFSDEGGIFNDLTSRASKRLKSINSNHDDRERSFACPFSKNDPLQHRKCLGLSLKRPKDVKQHIYRSHMNPEYYCAFCFDIFQTAADRDAHLRKRLCQERDCPSMPQFQGITDNQSKALKERLPRHLNFEEQWFQIYDIIFPDSSKPRSAYVDSRWEDLVALLRRKWQAQCHDIIKRATGCESHFQLSSAIDLLFEDLEQV